MVPQHIRRSVAGVVLAVISFVLSTSLRAQGVTRVADLSTLPIAERYLAPGQEMRGGLTRRDALWVDNSYVQAWGLEMEAGGHITVDLISDDFDAYLMVVGPGLEILQDDDGAGSCDARLTFTAPESGIFRVVVNTATPETTGIFRVRVSEVPFPPTADGCVSDVDLAVIAAELETLPIADRWLSVGNDVLGELTTSDSVGHDGSFLQAWGLDLQAGREVTVELISEDFDAFLWIVGPGLEAALNDDDGAGGCDARITFTPEQDGVFRAVVNAVMAGETGTFILHATEVPWPVMAEECVHGPDIPVLGSGTELSVLPIEGRWLTFGAEAVGDLAQGDSVSDDGSYVEAWGLALRSGQEVTVDLISDDFDAFLWIVGPGLQALNDDDSAGECHARITFSAPEDGTYRVIPNTLFAGGSGSFVLRVNARPGRQLPGNCSF